jgi:hypothetical protein
MKYLNLAMLAVFLPLAPSFAAAEHPCKQIVTACQSAGFVKGDHKDKKGLWKDCVRPIKAGQTVAGVTIDPSVVQACTAKKAAKAAKGAKPVAAGVKTNS